MLTERQFKVLSYLANHQNCVQREIAEQCKMSIGSVNSVIKSLREQKLINDIAINSNGLKALEPYKVNNAIILAAGMATRFVPVSYEIPKGLIKVKGVPLIERLILQLREAGINEIIVVVGYMMEKFLYLRDKYNVKFVINNEFAEKNTHSSIYAARDYMKNTLVICADNYYPNNMFNKYEYHTYYCSIYLPGVGYTERSLVTNSKGLVIDTHKPSVDEWILYGHAYWDSNFSKAFKPILENYYGRPGIENYYWETVWSENLKKCPMWIKKCEESEILEFDSVKELEAFDKNYILHNNTSIMNNICKALSCEPTEVDDFRPLKTGLNNRSFTFYCKGQQYVYRHPGKNAEGVIDRKKEAFSQRYAQKLEIDSTLVYIDEITGWKISKYIEIGEEFDFNNMGHISQLASHLKKLHEANIKTHSNFSYIEEADKLTEIVKRVDYDSYINIQGCRDEILPIYNKLQSDNWQVSLCHNDIYEPNLLVSKEGKVSLIDWEFAGDTDIGYDICKLFACLNPDFDKIDFFLSLYYNRAVTIEEKKHLIGCATIIYYYWYVWGIYASKNGSAVQEYILKWYDKMQSFKDLYLKLNNQKGE